MPGPGRLVAFEGIDGSGKTTQAGRLAGRLGPAAVLTREPGGTGLGRQLRTLLLDAARPTVSDRAEALLMAADRAQHVDELVAPALAAGRWVVTDRFSASTLAYQGGGRGLRSDELAAVVSWAAAGVEPDLNVLVDVPLDVARRRIGATDPDRFERLDADFHRRVRDAYRSLADGHPRSWLVVDGNAAVDVVADEVWEGVVARLGRPAAAAP